MYKNYVSYFESKQSLPCALMDPTRLPIGKPSVTVNSYRDLSKTAACVFAARTSTVTRASFWDFKPPPSTAVTLKTYLPGVKAALAVTSAVAGSTRNGNCCNPPVLDCDIV